MEETKINQGEVLDGGGEISQTNEGKNISQNLGFDTMLQYVMRERRRRVGKKTDASLGGRDHDEESL